MYVLDWTDDEIVDAAAKILEGRAARGEGEPVMGAPAEAAQIAILRIGTLEYEAFSAFWLDAQNRLIEYEQLFRGTLTQTSVYPPMVRKRQEAFVGALLILDAGGRVAGHEFAVFLLLRRVQRGKESGIYHHAPIFKGAWRRGNA